MKLHGRARISGSCSPVAQRSPLPLSGARGAPCPLTCSHFPQGWAEHADHVKYHGPALTPGRVCPLVGSVLRGFQQCGPRGPAEPCGQQQPPEVHVGAKSVEEEGRVSRRHRPNWSSGGPQPPPKKLQVSTPLTILGSVKGTSLYFAALI